MAQEGSDDEYDPDAEQHETEAEDEGTEAEAEDDPAFVAFVEVDNEFVLEALTGEQPQQQPVGSKRKRRSILIHSPYTLKRPRQSIGGVARIGAVGQRSLGKYGAGMQTSCEDCGGGPQCRPRTPTSRRSMTSAFRARARSRSWMSGLVRGADMCQGGEG
jgi:hypothetical protein